MRSWLRSLFTRQATRPHAIEPTMEAMRETRQVADDLNQGKIVTSERFREIERKLTGNVAEEAVTGQLGRRSAP